jgi:hypothetical protein
LFSRARFLAVIPTAGLAPSSAAPAGAALNYKQQKSQASSSGNVAAKWVTSAGAAS